MAMATTASSLFTLSLFLLLTSFLATTSHAKVPANETFKYVNEGNFGPFITEYDASYRALPLFESPFQLMWYNTTPGQFYIGLRMGLRRSESTKRWVWDANRGRPVGENATLTFATDGNLVLAEADGRVVWQTGTANKGVVALRLLPTGNIVLLDKKGKFLWQSFDHPTDTLLVGGSLYVGGPTKLVSRKSEADNSDGMYSFELEPKGMNLYLTIGGKRLRYSDNRFAFTGSSPPPKSTFIVEPEDDNATYRMDIGSYPMFRPKFNTTLSLLRVTIDGDLIVYTYYIATDYFPWEKTYTFFSSNQMYGSQEVEGFEIDACNLPTKCGALGVCENEMCVGCPTAKGLLSWKKSCAPPAAGACKTGAAVDYFKVDAVEHFVPLFNKGEGKMKVEDCKQRCSKDCKCLAVFYRKESSQCWLAPTLGTLYQGTNSSHAAYIKYYK